MESHTITPEEVKAKLDSGDPMLLLDCREPQECAIARIKGAIEIPMGEIPTHQQELDPELPIVVFCHHGMRSLSVTMFLLENDFDDVKSMNGGIDAWSMNIDPKVPRY